MNYVMDDVIYSFFNSFTTKFPFEALKYNFYNEIIIIEVV